MTDLRLTGPQAERSPLLRPRLLLRAEGLALLVVSVTAYLELGGHWGYLWLGFLADLSFAGYLVRPRLGAALYNLVHSTVVPLSLTVAGLLLNHEFSVFVGLVVLAHIGFDRAAGYGLKYPDAFHHTHLSP